MCTLFSEFIHLSESQKLLQFSRTEPNSLLKYKKCTSNEAEFDVVRGGSTGVGGRRSGLGGLIIWGAWKIWEFFGENF